MDFHLHLRAHAGRTKPRALGVLPAPRAPSQERGRSAWAPDSTTTPSPRRSMGRGAVLRTAMSTFELQATSPAFLLRASSRKRALRMTMSFRITAVIATFSGLPSSLRRS